MCKKLLSTLLLFLAITHCNSQETLELVSIKYHSLSTTKTLELFKESSVRNNFLKNLDSTVQKWLSLKLSYPTNFTIEAEKGGITNSKRIRINGSQPSINTKKKTGLSISIDIAELPLTDEVNKQDWSTELIEELSKKINTCFYQLYATITNSNDETIFDKNLYVILSRQNQSGNIGYEHPDFALSPVGLNKMIESCLPILLDSTNGSELIQIRALPALMSDNFIQPNLINYPKIVTTINKNIIQYINKSGLQYLRFQEPEYFLIELKGKKITPLSFEVQHIIKSEKNNEFIFLWEESRDIMADKNYKLLTIATVNNTASFGQSIVLRNIKTGLPFQFLKGSSHKLLLNNDTIGSFSIQTQLTDSSHKKMYHQLFIAKDNSIFRTSEKDSTVSQFYPYTLKGNLYQIPFKILNSGMSGIESIREIYYNNKLICIAQGKIYPELLCVLDPDINTVTLNQLLLIAFSSLF